MFRPALFRARLAWLAREMFAALRSSAADSAPLLGLLGGVAVGTIAGTTYVVTSRSTSKSEIDKVNTKLTNETDKLNTKLKNETDKLKSETASLKEKLIDQERVLNAEMLAKVAVAKQETAEKFLMLGFSKEYESYRRLTSQSMSEVICVIWNA